MLKNNNLNLFLFILLIIIFSFFAFKVTTLQIVDYKADEVIWEQKVKNGESFNLKYLHSVAKTPVIEFFEIKDGKILLTGTEYQSYGAGLPTSAEEGDYIVENDKFIIKNIDRFLPEILLRISSNSQHEFNYNNQNYNLFDKAEKSNFLQIKTERTSYFKFIYKEVIKWLKKNI